jgi:hypothetical protein
MLHVQKQMKNYTLLSTMRLRIIWKLSFYIWPSNSSNITQVCAYYKKKIFQFYLQLSDTRTSFRVWNRLRNFKHWENDWWTEIKSLIFHCNTDICITHCCKQCLVLERDSRWHVMYVGYLSSYLKCNCSRKVLLSKTSFTVLWRKACFLMSRLLVTVSWQSEQIGGLSSWYARQQQCWLCRACL